jgi:transposase-like protein
VGKANFTEEFKRDRVRLITERGYLVAEVSQRLRVSQNSLYQWKKKFGTSNGAFIALRRIRFSVRMLCRLLHVHPE